MTADRAPRHRRHGGLFRRLFQRLGGRSGLRRPGRHGGGRRRRHGDLVRAWGIAYNHLGASDARGYDAGASYALYDAAAAHFAGAWALDLAAARAWRRRRRRPRPLQARFRQQHASLGCAAPCSTRAAMTPSRPDARRPISRPTAAEGGAGRPARRGPCRRRRSAGRRAETPAAATGRAPRERRRLAGQIGPVARAQIRSAARAATAAAASATTIGKASGANAGSRSGHRAKAPSRCASRRQFRRRTRTIAPPPGYPAPQAAGSSPTTRPHARLARLEQSVPGLWRAPVRVVGAGVLGRPQVQRRRRGAGTAERENSRPPSATPTSLRGCR